MEVERDRWVNWGGGGIHDGRRRDERHMHGLWIERLLPSKELS